MNNMRSREEIETRLNHLVAFLAYADPSDESVVRAHARALDNIKPAASHCGFNPSG